MPKLFEFQGETLPSWYDGNYEAPWHERNYDLIRDDGASQMVIVPTVYMDTLNSTHIYRHKNEPGGHNTDRYTRTESDDPIRYAIREAKERGLEVVFKLHVNIQNEAWNALIGPPAGSTPTQAKAWADAWFASYKEQVLHYARLAKEQGVTTFTIGNECESITKPAYTAYWKDIIASVRAEVGTDLKLTYAATWTEALHVGFWEDLDYVGANPYIAFSNKTDPTLQEMIAGWTERSEVPYVRGVIDARFPGQNLSAIDALRKIAEEAGKKLIFTETGFRSLDGTNRDPGVYTSNGQVDELEQLDMFKAFFKIITDRVGEGWIAGYWFWNYAAGTDSYDENADDNYYTHGKLADTVVEQYFKNPTSVVGRKLVGKDNPQNLNDTLLGGFNHDTLIGGKGSDALLGGGADVFVYNGGDGADTITDFKAAEGDKISLLNAGVIGFSDLNISAIAGGNGYVVTFADGGSITILTKDTLSANWFLFNTTGQSGPSTRPTSGNDELTGTAKGNVIDAGAGDDLVNGLGGNDRLYGGTGIDTLNGGEGNDQLYGGAGLDIVNGGTGNDRLYGGADTDILHGNAGNDQVRGDDGNDMLYDDAGNDLIRGGIGNDQLYGGDDNDKLYSDVGNDNAQGGQGHDTIYGHSGNDTLNGGEGNDRLHGGSGNDNLQGWFGNDMLWGSSGGDTIAAGGGVDRIWGGTGEDRFVIGQGFGHDTIYDFKLKQGDQLIIQSNMNGLRFTRDTFASLQQRMKQVGSDTVIDLGSTNGVVDTITLKNFKASTLDVNDF
jgi:Ca2+-binding RTX toxin-like protein